MREKDYISVGGGGVPSKDKWEYHGDILLLLLLGVNDILPLLHISKTVFV